MQNIVTNINKSILIGEDDIKLNYLIRKMQFGKKLTKKEMKRAKLLSHLENMTMPTK